MNKSNLPSQHDLQLLKEIKPGSFVFEQKGALSLDSCSNIIRRFEEAGAEDFCLHSRRRDERIVSYAT